MSYLVAVDDGHGINTPGKRTPEFTDGHITHENEFNRTAARYCIAALARCGFRTIETAPGDEDTPLKERCDIANNANADVFVSFHYDASGSSWTDIAGGRSVYYYPGSPTGYRLAQCVHKNLIQGTQMPDRGIKSEDFYVLRETKMPAVLCECGFMNVMSQAKLMVDSKFQMETAEHVCMGICEYFNIPYSAPAIKDSKPVISSKIPDSIEGIKTIVKQPVGYDEYLLKENRRIIHLNNGTYISIDPEGIRMFVNGALIKEFK